MEHYTEIYRNVETPCYIVEERLLKKNAKILSAMAKQSGAHILLAQKAFSMFAAYPMLRKYLSGTTASGLFEARLGYEEFGGETHVFSPAYTKEDFIELLPICDHIVLNTPDQLFRFYDLVQAYRESDAGKGRAVSLGLRINPEYSEIETDLYNPCSTGSRLGTVCSLLKQNEEVFDMIEGLHFHTLCEQGADALERTLTVVEKNFGTYLSKKTIRWINFGGGHHITRPGYDLQKLISCVRHFREQYHVDVYIEPGEAVALNAGFLVSSVLDFHKNGIDIAILDTSASCHMPDVLEMPYRPQIIGAGLPGEKPYLYRLGGPTCLAGDVIGDYSFDHPLQIGERLIFCDMAHYSMVKNNTFNGMKLPSILYRREDGVIQTVRQFGYQDFKMRLS